MLTSNLLEKCISRAKFNFDVNAFFESNNVICLFSCCLILAKCKRLIKLKTRKYLDSM